MHDQRALTSADIIAGGAAFSAYAAASYAVLQRINEAAGEPYMDEAFHVPQAQQYCAGRFDAWDPKLTTPPGLYLVSSMALGPTNSRCTTAHLRLTNWILGLLVFWSVFAILRTLHPRLSAATTAAATLAVSITPVVFFFHHLYYTDTGSLLFVLLAYAASLRDRHLVAAALGFASLWFRQTNVVWAVVFVGGTAVLRRVRRVMGGIGGDGESLASETAQLVRWMVPRAGACERWRVIMAVVAPYVCVGLAFAAFVCANHGSIVLGDKAHHQAAIHLPQAMYFCAYAGFVLAPTVLAAGAGVRWTIGALRSPRNLAQTAALCVVLGVCVKHFTIEHPFLLSDNRHYPFYVWKNLVRRHWTVRYAAIPAYVYSAAAIHRCLAARSAPTDALWRAVFAVCTAAVLVPSPLLEPRYFTIPLVIARLHMADTTFGMRRLAMEAAWCGAINAVTIWVFLNKPFAWDSEPGRLQRFMW
ncbi:glucosyltransferase [Coemansia sp. RSA 2049]|nr:glucosyltransferase [Coemansia sp. RSA 2049]KAJ2523425.1 glucosyltransferase [Coemansia sp. RSA 1939]KAJ2618226.1 glucosyltransferase [Coemansia sp. RSA 1804]KAJ2695228.1 glucosyltransferase [Coemansia sp. RSA 1285]